GVVDEPFPAHSSAGLFEVHPHDDFKFTRKAAALFSQPTRVIEGGCRVVDGTRPDDDDQAVVVAGQNGVHGLARIGHDIGDFSGTRELAHDVRRRCEFLDFPDAKIISIVGHGLTPEYLPVCKRYKKKPPSVAGGFLGIRCFFSVYYASLPAPAALEK